MARNLLLIHLLPWLLTVLGLASVHAAPLPEPTRVQLVLVAPAGASVPDRLGDEIRIMERSANAWLVKQAGRQVRVRRDPDGNALIPTVRLEQSEEVLFGMGDAVMTVLTGALDTRFADVDDVLVFIYQGRVDLRSKTHCGRRVGRVAGLFLGNDGCTRHRFASGDGQGWDKIFLHELFHALGAVAVCAPNDDDARHVADSASDLMHRNGGGRMPQLDVGRDDYFGHGRDDCPDLQRSVLLEATAGSQPPTGNALR